MIQSIHFSYPLYYRVDFTGERFYNQFDGVGKSGSFLYLLHYNTV
jgi:hypothetical protein